MLTGIVPPAEENCDDSYTVPRGILIDLVGKSFTNLDDYRRRLVAENLLYRAILCMEPHEMTEEWCRGEVEHLVKYAQMQVEKGGVPCMAFSPPRWVKYIPLLSEDELDAMHRKQSEELANDPEYLRMLGKR